MPPEPAIATAAVAGVAGVHFRVPPREVARPEPELLHGRRRPDGLLEGCIAAVEKAVGAAKDVGPYGDGALAAVEVRVGRDAVPLAVPEESAEES